ncbi:PilW family protein [Ralstonia soli]|uniref:Prepilin-type N-terminal cleavage/methylation domain-containing protein n=1 Tax=Ralstonia soli TaxID=2953896 RepID=A0ABT1ANM5_9RALS|nr:prepilin-type N-terminal cleavage/methylation domain-containing protein [Ralstonia soli]MCO5400041.1 prepilin-type N-terminal cleavage/methylation domain-containing protein [Ralstonia soli]
MLNRALYRQRQRGLSLVELMVGITIGLFIVAGALTLFASSLLENRRLIAQTRLEQDMRSIADLMTRDIRRAGYWGNSIQGTLAIGATATTASNPYVGVSATPSSTSGVLKYNFSRDLVENNILDTNEQFGYQLLTTGTKAGVMQMLTAQNVWSDLNDANFTVITSFSVTDSSPPALSLGYRCPVMCAAGTPNCPQMFIRRYDIVLTGRSTLDASVVRTLRTSVRVRNDQTTGSC